MADEAQGGAVRSIRPLEGFAREVGLCAASMEELRASLVRGVEDLSTETLARRAYAGANTIGTLLIHVAEAELFWMQEVIKREPLTATQRQEYRFDIFGRPGAPAVEAHDFGYFRKRMDEARVVTRRVLEDLGDEDLEQARTWEDMKSGEKREFTVRWILQHLIEHEAHHRGQVFLLKRALGF